MRQSRYNVVVDRGDTTWVYNGLSGRYVALDADDWNAARAFIAGDPVERPPVQVLQELTLARMVVTDDLDEVALLERRYRAGVADRTSFGLTIVTSLGCNFDCPYCFQVKPRAILDDETVGLLLDVLDEQLRTIRQFHVTWFGGEPLLATDRIYELSREFRARCERSRVDYSASVVTNGYLLTPAVAAALRGHGVRSAQITLDGPPETHNRMRPLRNGRGTFDVILDNVAACADLIPIAVRVNLDTHNVGDYRSLLDLFVERGLAGRIAVYPGQIVAYDDGIGAPSESYRPACFTVPEFAAVEREFWAEAFARDLAAAELPEPVSTPCTAVRANELVVGANGELYKCWDSVGNDREVVGHLRTWKDPNDRILKWLSYDPFADDGCRSCIALPTCMGGCAHHAFSGMSRDSQCSTFRLTHRQQVEEYAAAAEARGVTTGVRRRVLPIAAVGAGQHASETC